MITRRSNRTYRRPRSRWARRRTTRPVDRWPSWRELARRNVMASPENPAGTDRRSIRRLTMYVLMAAALSTAYVWHVYATRAVLREVQQLRREHRQLVLQYNRLRGEFDRATSPAVIYRRAQALGLEEGFTYGPVVIRENP
ncbi:MAG: hypothetical protein Q9M35_09140 [Rhodothermus sp.]|nr:hypothetical protein [Rhodothermus sp.]